MDKDKALDAALAGIDKQFGKGAVMKMGEKSSMDIGVIPTGALSLDLALGIGGLPRGRVIEVYGPESSGKSTLAMHVVAEAQRNGGKCAYIDAEHAMDPIYAAAIGVDVDELLISQPDTGEQALEITDYLVKSGALDVIVVDSVAALTPRAEIEGEMGDSHVGLQARLMSQALRKLTANLNKTNTVIIFINQLREKIGVMFGCFNYSTRVVLADGTTEKIGKIVNQEMDVEVLSYNPDTGRIEPRRVVDWHRNGTADHFLQFTVDKGYGKGTSSFACTPNHMIFTPGGEVAAGTLRPGDEVLTRLVDRKFTDDQWQIALGSVLGDGSIIKATGSKCRLRIGHGAAQDEYLRWKADILGAPVWTGTSGSVEAAINSEKLMCFAGLQSRKTTRTSIPSDLIDAMDRRAFAIWYLDDGSLSGSHSQWGAGKATISIKATDNESRLRLAERAAKIGLGTPYVSEAGLLVWSGEEAREFFAGIGEFVPESMRRKVPAYAPAFSWDPDRSVDPDDVVLAQTIRSIGIKPETRSMQKFDITVDGNHSYLVDDVVVHNSPETTPGGRALKFYSSVRLDIRRIESIKNGVEIVGNRTRVKVVKNKVAPPFKQAEFDIMYGKGISLEGSLLDIGTDLGIIKKSGAWYTYNGQQLGQGRENAKQTIVEDEELFEVLNHLVRDELNLKGYS